MDGRAGVMRYDAMPTGAGIPSRFEALPSSFLPRQPLMLLYADLRLALVTRTSSSLVLSFVFRKRYVELSLHCVSARDATLCRRMILQTQGHLVLSIV